MTPLIAGDHARSVPFDRMLAESAFMVTTTARELERAGADVVHLELGEPNLPGPPQMIPALLAGLNTDGGGRYIATAGEEDIRRQVAAHYARLLTRPVRAREIMLVPGSNMVLYLALLTLVAPGDEVMIPDPGFPPYAELVRLVGGMPVGYRVDGDAATPVDPDQVRSLMTPRTRLIIINFPHNPTGSVADSGLMSTLIADARAHGAEVLCDITYSDFVYRADLTALPSVLDAGTIVLDSMSKSRSMCGWRIGIGIAPPTLVERMSLVMVNLNCCMPSFIQRAIPTALAATEWVRGIVAEYAARREVALSALATMPRVTLAPPLGGFYAFPDISATGLPDRVFADRLLREAGVAVVPGSLYGPGGAGHIRLAYTQPEARLKEGMDRIRRFLEALP